MAVSCERLKGEISDIIFDTELPVKVDDSRFKLNRGKLMKTLECVYGEAFIGKNKDWILYELPSILRKMPFLMYEEFTEFLESKEESELWDFEEIKLESKEGEHFVLTKDLKQEFQSYDEWIMCISPHQNKGIVMLRQCSEKELFFIYFTNPYEIIENHFPVIQEYPQVFEIETWRDHYLIVPITTKF